MCNHVIQKHHQILSLNIISVSSTRLDHSVLKVVFFNALIDSFSAGGPYPPPPGHFSQPVPGQMGPGPSHFVHVGSHTATVLAPPGAATTVTVLQGEMFQTSPVQTVCPHCQQAIITRISHDVGLMNTLFCLFCFFVG